MAHLTPPHCETPNWQSHENFLGQGFLAPLHLAGIKIMSSTGRGALGVTSPLVLQPQDSSHPSILPQSTCKHFSCSLFRRDAPYCPLVSSGLTFEACTFPQILHYYSMIRDGVVLSFLVAQHPKVPCPCTILQCSSYSDLLIFVFAPLQGIHKLFLTEVRTRNPPSGVKEVPFSSVLYPPFPSFLCLPLPAQVSLHPQPPYQASPLSPLVL